MSWKDNCKFSPIKEVTSGLQFLECTAAAYSRAGGDPVKSFELYPQASGSLRRIFSIPALLTYNSFKVYWYVVFSISTELCSHHHNQF